MCVFRLAVSLALAGGCFAAAEQASAQGIQHTVKHTITRLSFYGGAAPTSAETSVWFSSTTDTNECATPPISDFSLLVPNLATNAKDEPHIRPVVRAIGLLVRAYMQTTPVSFTYVCTTNLPWIIRVETNGKSIDLPYR